MAKNDQTTIMLRSTADTGIFYLTKKSSKNNPEKLVIKKYDKKARKHVDFKESKMK